MIEDLNFDIELLLCPTVREEDGLAMSSRNNYLSAEERARANCLYRALTNAKKLFDGGEREALKLKQEMKRTVRATGVSVDYIEVVDAVNLQPLEKIKRRTLLAGAIWAGSTRLIDNMVIEP